jgi:hypothetical protein
VSLSINWGVCSRRKLLAWAPFASFLPSFPGLSQDVGLTSSQQAGEISLLGYPVPEQWSLGPRQPGEQSGCPWTACLSGL